MDLQQLAQVETLCNNLYQSADPQQRADAEQALRVFHTSPDSLTKCKFILENSSLAFAQLLASNSLTKAITSHWNVHTVQDRLEIRNYILSYLANKGPTLETFVISSLLTLLCRITKLAWFDDQQHRDITEHVTKFLEATVDHCMIGLRILNQLLEEMNTNLPGRSLTTHRKTAVSFRDNSLFGVFQVALNTLKQSISLGDNSDKVREQALKLALACLSYDFIGTTMDESSEDIGTIQMPSSWRWVIEEPATLELFLQLYSSTQPPRSVQAMECLVQLSSVRRSLFSEEARVVFLTNLVKAIANILQNKIGLADHSNFHVFCRLLGRLKSNYQLSELVVVEGYKDWIALVADFTIQSLRAWQWASTSVYFLLSLWSRLVASMSYLRGDGVSYLENYVPEVTKTYILSRIESVRVCMTNSQIDDPLEDEEQLIDQVESVSALCRFQFENISAYLLSLMDPIIANLGALQAANNMAQVAIHEGELAWIVYIIGAIVGGRVNCGRSDTHETIDGDMCGRVFQLLQWCEIRAPTYQGGDDTTYYRLEMSLLSFFQSFRKAYIGDQANVSSTTIYEKLADKFGIPDSQAVLSAMMHKIVGNLKHWSQSQDMVSKTLTLFFDLANGYCSSRLLLKLDLTTYILDHHTSEYFPFLDVRANSRLRTSLYTTLTRILFMEDTTANFDSFMAQFLPTIQRLTEFTNGAMPQGPQGEMLKAAFVGLMRDLRGVTIGTTSKRSYAMLFEWMYPAHLGMFVRAVQFFSGVPAVCIPLLKFMAEFVFNKGQRLTFDCSSPNGILLFRETSKLLVAYGNATFATPVIQDAYSEKYKGISVCLTLITRALSGSYVNFGVFALYNDSALVDALGIALRLGLSIPLQDLMAYPKVFRSYFGFLDVLCLNHTAFVAELESAVFVQIVASLYEGMQSVEVAVSSQCATALDHLVAFHFTNARKDIPATHALNRHVQEHPDLFPKFLSLLFNVVMFEECQNQWSLSRPMLSLILTNEQYFQELQQQIIASQPADRHQRLMDVFSRLMLNVQRNLEPKNRDRFTQNLTFFRHEVKTFVG